VVQEDEGGWEEDGRGRMLGWDLFPFYGKGGFDCQPYTQPGQPYTQINNANL
jgi:hypothetical protein